MYHRRLQKARSGQAHGRRYFVLAESQRKFVEFPSATPSRVLSKYESTFESTKVLSYVSTFESTFVAGLVPTRVRVHVRKYESTSELLSYESTFVHSYCTLPSEIDTYVPSYESTFEGTFVLSYGSIIFVLSYNVIVHCTRTLRVHVPSKILSYLLSKVRKYESTFESTSVRCTLGGLPYLRRCESTSVFIFVQYACV